MSSDRGRGTLRPQHTGGGREEKDRKRGKCFIRFKNICLNSSNKEMGNVLGEGTVIIKMKTLKYVGIKLTRNMKKKFYNFFKV